MIVTFCYAIKVGEINQCVSILIVDAETFVQIDAFNVEEEAFNWPTTAYPQRLQILNILKPYLQLYELTVEFDNKYK